MFWSGGHLNLFAFSESSSPTNSSAPNSWDWQNLRAKPPQCSQDLCYGFFQFSSCGSYNIIKNPLNFNVPYKICALVKVSAHNYFWWINQEDKYVWSSCCSIQFLLYTSPAGAIIVMFQLVVSRASSCSQILWGHCEPWTTHTVLRACNSRLLWKSHQPKAWRIQWTRGEKCCTPPLLGSSCCVVWRKKARHLSQQSSTPELWIWVSLLVVLSSVCLRAW